MGDQLGMIRPGYIADLVAVETSPLEDPARLLEPLFVMKDGVVYKQCTGIGLDMTCTRPGRVHSGQ
jgi:imidazolonepropionase-like amidohydrolase